MTAERRRCPLLTRSVLWVSLVALVLRVAWAVPTAREPKGLSDPILYFGAARTIAAGRGYLSLFGTPTTYYPPGYPYFLASIAWLAERVGLEDHLALLNGLAGAFLGAVACGAVVVVGTRLGGRRVGIAAGLVLALWPNLIFYSSTVLSEPLYLATFSVFLAATLTMIDDDGRVVWVRAVTAGVAFGLCTLVRSQVLLVLPAMVIAWAFARVGWRSLAFRVGALTIGLVVVVSPWIIRNYSVFDAFVPVSSNAGDNLCIGFRPDASGAFAIPDFCDTGEFYVDGPDAERRRDAETRKRAVEWATSHLGELPALSLRKLWYTYRSDDESLYALESYGADGFIRDGPRTVLVRIATVAYLAIMFATLVGLVLVAWRGWRDRRADPTGLALLAATLASFIIPVLFFGGDRFKVPATPCYAVLAGVAIMAGIDLLSRRTGRVEPQPPAAEPVPPEGRARASSSGISH